MIFYLLKKYCGFLRKNSRFPVFSFVCLALLCKPAFGQLDDAILAWGIMEESGHHIYFSRHSQPGWSPPRQLSFSDEPEILPTLASNAQGEIWVIWTELAGSGGKLKFRYHRNGEWESPMSIQTDTVSDMAPSVIVDYNENVWLVWSGTDHRDDDIFFSRWQNGEWTRPEKVNTDDEWPDILPQISLSASGMPQVTWSGYDGNKYVTFISSWTGSAWSLEQVLHEPDRHLSNSPNRSAEIDMAAMIADLPDFVTDVNQATIHFRQQGRANTIRLTDK